VYRLIYTQQTD